ncbi:Alpha/Beta hydrolase protein [Aspergillus pseudotamarii]|uniref:Alpha/Beta hydrolase protein n=1 Tax=Aspergillus pseudotamarii TaxID=132259 RepID=A0A5N6SXM9_ASPPS|nr:Alpha/Beta hydrolase protein [Aspergillus pseudotamarii]KAE8139372.1 Alpha/Beta hydrolase protein [Aspergillus pseudotamarii]
MKHKLGVWETIDAWLGWVSVGATVVSAAIFGPFRGPSGADSYPHHVIQATVKKVAFPIASMTLHESNAYQHLQLTKYCEKIGVKPNFVSNERGLKGFWLGSPTAKYVVINFHGGGFAMDATAPYLDFWPGVASALADESISTGWFNVTYTLAPHATYPTQFREAVEALRYVIEELGRSPSEIILAGDSAGANLCLALLSHLSHPSEDAPPLAISAPLKAVVLLSPWLSFRQDWPTMKLNEHKDIDDRKVLERLKQGYLHGRSTNYYVEALEAPETWWQDAQVEHTLVLAGGDEMLLDSIKAWFKKFSKVKPETTLIVGQNECHVAPLIWPLFADKHETEQGLALKAWLIERLRI